MPVERHIMNYKPLETDFIKNGFRHRQIWRNGDFAVFHKLAISGPIRPTSHDAGFETVIISRHDGYERGGVKMEPAETYPSHEQWGTKGWSYGTLYAAEVRFEKLLRGEFGDTEEPSVTEDKPQPEQKRTRRPKGEPIILSVPDTDFSIKDLAELNKVDYSVAFLWAKEAIDKEIQFLREERRAAKGKPSKIYAKKQVDK